MSDTDNIPTEVTSNKRATTRAKTGKPRSKQTKKQKLIGLLRAGSGADVATPSRVCG